MKINPTWSCSISTEKVLSPPCCVGQLWCLEWTEGKEEIFSHELGFWPNV